MTITITKEEAQKIVNALGEAPGKFVYEVIKFFESKIIEASKEEPKVEESKAENA